jgi:hypothetical protein
MVEVDFFVKIASPSKLGAYVAVAFLLLWRIQIVGTT